MKTDSNSYRSWVGQAFPHNPFNLVMTLEPIL